MIIATPNISYRTFTIRRYHNSKVIAKYHTKPITTKVFNKMRLFGTESWNKYIRDNNLKNLKK
jgi:hypothetical protein